MWPIKNYKKDYKNYKKDRQTDIRKYNIEHTKKRLPNEIHA